MKGGVAPARDAMSAFEEAFERADAAAARDAADPMAWFAPVRRDAMGRFRALGFPTTRNEDWRFTSLASLTSTAFRPASAGAPLPAAAALAPFAIPGFAGPMLVFVNGRYEPALGRAPAAPLPAGVYLGSFRGAPESAAKALRDELARHAGFDNDAFSALNTAFVDDGALIVVPRGVVLDDPIHIMSVTTADAAAGPIAVHGRALVVAGDAAEVSVVEDYVSLGEGAHFSNAVTEVVAADGAVVTHTLIERENHAAFNISTLAIRQGRNANVTSHSVLLGGAVVRNNVRPVLAGEGGECLVNGLFMAKGSQHMDNYMHVRHAAPHCGSRQFYKGILDDRAHGVFHGRIVVEKGAQKTDAKQTNRNLLLSRDAQVDTKPQLEIYADDVKCTHGATIGQVDEEAIFYLRSRGIPAAEARALLLLAFAGESLARMKDGPVRAALETMVREWFR